MGLLIVIVIFDFYNNVKVLNILFKDAISKHKCKNSYIKILRISERLFWVCGWK